MQDHARRIRLRHMMYQVIAEDGQSLPIDAITDQLMELFRKDQDLIDALLPELTGEEAAATFGGHNSWVPIHKALRYMVLREFTTGVRRTDCLESMGLVRVAYDGLNAKSKGVQELAETLGISPEAAVEAVSLILDNWRRNRILYVDGRSGLLPLPCQGRSVYPGGPAAVAGIPARRVAAWPRSFQRICTLPDRSKGCLGSPGPSQEMGVRSEKPGRGRRRRDSLGIAHQRSEGSHESYLAVTEGEGTGRRRMAGEFREAGGRAIPGSSTLYDLPAACHPPRPEERLHPP